MPENPEINVISNILDYEGLRIGGVGDGEVLREEVWAHVAKPEFTWTQKWRVGDIVLWDNRYCLHCRDAFPSDTRRHMRRTQIGGDRPVAA